MNQKIITYNKDTGELYKEEYRKFDIFPDDKGYLFWAKKYHRKIYSEIKLSKIVKDKFDFMRMHLLAEYIYKDTNIIMIRASERKVRVADVDDISQIIELSYKKTKEYLSRMKKLHVIAERIDNVGDTISSKFVINPLFFNSNKFITTDLYFLFQESLNQYLPQWAISKYHEMSNLKQRSANYE